EPTREADAGGFLRVHTTAYLGSFTVGVNGRARTFTACTVTVTPAALDFGTIPPGTGEVLGLKVGNSGVELCAVKNIEVVDSAGGAFFMPGGVIDGLLIWPGDYFSFMVAYKSPLSPQGPTAGSLQIETADPNQPRILVPLTVHGEPSCIVAAPPYLDFG